jgi:hypothetical protein
MAFKMNGNPAGNIQKLKIHGKSELFKKSGAPSFFGKLLDPLGLRKKIGGKLCGSKLFNPGGAGGPAAAAQAAAPAAAAAVDPGAAAGIPAPAVAAAPVEEAAAGPAVMREKNKLTGKPGAPWRFMTEEEEFRVAKKNNRRGRGRLAESKSLPKSNEPTKPVEPVEPVGPAEPPTKPTKPTEPTEPTKPTEGKGGGK